MIASFLLLKHQTYKHHKNICYICVIHNYLAIYILDIITRFVCSASCKYQSENPEELNSVPYFQFITYSRALRKTIIHYK